MATRIRLRRVGRKKVPLYRIVVAERTAARDGRFLEVLGSYDPRAERGKNFTLDAARARTWLARGATPSDTVAALLRQAGVLGETSRES
jgi:small subunit ribosomal protein S16